MKLVGVISGGSFAKPAELLDGGSCRQVFRVPVQEGLHLRPAAMLVSAAERYEADITIQRDGFAVSARSIMGILTLEAAFGAELLVEAAGEDAEDALAAIAELFSSNFSL